MATEAELLPSLVPRVDFNKTANTRVACALIADYATAILECNFATTIFVEDLQRPEVNLDIPKNVPAKYNPKRNNKKPNERCKPLEPPKNNSSSGDNDGGGDGYSGSGGGDRGNSSSSNNHSGSGDGGGDDRGGEGGDGDGEGTKQSVVLLETTKLDKPHTRESVYAIGDWVESTTPWYWRGQSPESHRIRIEKEIRDFEMKWDGY
jgi:hypothetical protein